MFLALLPVRNGDEHLCEWFANVRGVVDGVLALDDGSTDSTLEQLRANSLVQRVLENPRRPDVTGWDDHDNRQRLLNAAIELGADWVIWLDADERFAPGDGPRLRRFVEGEADADAAYGMALYDQICDDLVAPDPKWVYRLHSVSANDRLPERRLHFPPVPNRVPRRRWLRTNLRIVHLGMATPARRQARYDKYLLADPDREWQASYEHLLTSDVEPAPLPAVPDEPIVLPVHLGDRLHTTDLTVVVIAHNDRDRIDAVVASVINQVVDATVQVILVVSGTDGTAAQMAARDDVDMIDLGASASPGAARTAASGLATGDFVVFVGAHVRLEPGSLAARLAAHQRGWALVSGSIVDGSTTRVGRAAFLLDHATFPPTRTAGELAVAPARCSYVRFALDRVGWFPDVRAGEDTAVNLELFDRGFSAYFEPLAIERYASSVSSVSELRGKHRVRGEALRRIRRERGAAIPRLGFGYCLRRMRRMAIAAWRHPDRWPLFAAFPLAVRAVLAARAGYVGRRGLRARRGRTIHI